MSMTILEFLDRIGERRARRPYKNSLPDIRQLIGAAFIFGYYFLVYRFVLTPIPEANKDLIRDAMLTLGPPIGLIVGAMFRSDAKEEQATVNTGKFADALKEQAKASQPTADVILEPGETAKAAIPTNSVEP